MIVTPDCVIFEVVYTDMDGKDHSSSPMIFAFNYDIEISDALEIAKRELNDIFGKWGTVVKGIKELKTGFIILYSEEGSNG